MAEGERGRGPIERRRFPRLQVVEAISVSAGDGVMRASLENVGRGGARFVVPDKCGEIGDSLEVFLPAPDGEVTGFHGKIVRLETREAGIAAAVRFTLVDAISHQALDEALMLLLQGKEHRAKDTERRHARITRRLELHYHGAQEFSATLEDMSTHGLGMTVDVPLAREEEVVLVIPDSKQQELLRLRSNVVYQRASSKQGNYRVGLEFADMTPERRHLLEALLSFFATGK